MSVVAVLLAAASTAAAADSCPNAELRTGLSANLPDCRAYELVSPAEAAGLGASPNGFSGILQGFDTSLVSPSGDSVIFNSIGGALPGLGGSGFTDAYRAVRGPEGWTSELVGPTAEQTEEPVPGGASLDHGYGFFRTDTILGGDGGSWIQEAAQVRPLWGESQVTSWLRHPDGSFEPVGRGVVADDYDACGTYIAPGGTHIVFESADCSRQYQAYGYPVQLLDDAPPDGTPASLGTAVYDRASDGLHTVSLLPGDGTPDKSARFAGVSRDGSVILFTLVNDSPARLYARLDNAETVVVASGPAIDPAGVSANGDTVFYAQAGDVFAFDTASETTMTVVDSGDAQLSNVSADGSHVYFVSQQQLDGANGTAGQSNLYVWDAATETIGFIATVAAADVTGPQNLVAWTSQAVAPAKDAQTGPANNLSRSTPDGSVLVFQSRAQLTGYANGGLSEIYRYDTADASLVCVSCDPQGDPPIGDATLQEINIVAGGGFGPTALHAVANVTEDGERVFFQSRDRLAAGDVGITQDVYQWDASGPGTPAVSLISSGNSPERHAPGPPFGAGELIPTNALYGVTPDGSDVLILVKSIELLDEDKTDGVGAIYDARVGGGFPSEAVASEVPCTGDACQGAPSDPPASSPKGSQDYVGAGNPRAGASCASLSRQARRLGARAKRLRLGARRAQRSGRARQLRRRSVRASKQAKRLSTRARSCRRAAR